MINLFFKVCLFAAIFIASSKAEEICDHCGKNDVEAIPHVKEIEMPNKFNNLIYRSISDSWESQLNLIRLMMKWKMKLL